MLRARASRLVGIRGVALRSPVLPLGHPSAQALASPPVPLNPALLRPQLTPRPAPRSPPSSRLPLEEPPLGSPPARRPAGPRSAGACQRATPSCRLFLEARSEGAGLCSAPPLAAHGSQKMRPHLQRGRGSSGRGPGRPSSLALWSPALSTPPEPGSGSARLGGGGEQRARRGAARRGGAAWSSGRAGGRPGREPAEDRRRAAAEIQVSSRSSSPDRRPEPGLVLVSRGARVGRVLGVAGRLMGARLARLRGSMAPLSGGCEEDVAEVATEGGGGLRKSRRPGRRS